MIRLQQLLAILLVTLTLCGVQVIQASPLHDHGSEVAGCALCHHGIKDNLLPAATLYIADSARPHYFPELAIRASAGPSFLPFQSRAPPFITPR